MNMSIENQREPLNPCTLIVLKILSDFLGETLKKSNLEDANEIVKAERALREIEEGYLTDLLWGRLTFRLTDTNPQPPVFPPILDILQICADARIKDMRCEIYVTNQEKHEYQKTVSMGFLRMIKHVLPDGADEQTQEQSLALWNQLEEGPIFTNLGEADHLCSSLVTARQEVIGRDHHQNMEDNPHKDPSIGTTDRFIRHNPIRLLFLSSPKKIQKAFSEALDQYLIDFQRKRIKWDANILPYNRQTVTLFSIFSRKQELFGDSFWFSQKDFSTIDPLVLDGYKPIEALLILARQGRIDVQEAGAMEGLSTIRLLINMKFNVVSKKLKTKDVPEEKEAEDEAQKTINQYVSLNAKKRILAQIVLDYLPIQDEKGVIIIDPSELTGSIPSFSKRGLHDLCKLMVKEGYFKKAEDHYPRGKLEPAWNYIGPLEIDHYDRIMRISIVPDVKKLEKLAFLAPAENSIGAKYAAENDADRIVIVKDVEVNISRQKMTYLNIRGDYDPDGLPWRIIRLCASQELDGLGVISLAEIGEDEDTVSKALTRINKKWKPKRVKILSMKKGYIYIDPEPISAHVEIV